jgi:hypothetical protein
MEFVDGASYVLHRNPLQVRLAGDLRNFRQHLQLARTSGAECVRIADGTVRANYINRLILPKIEVGDLVRIGFVTRFILIQRR